MEKILYELLHHARATWRRRWWILPIAWLVCLVGWAYVQSLPDVYQSNSRVYVNTQSVLDPLLRGMTVRPNTEQRLRMITRTLLSQDNLEQIARDADLDVLTGNSSVDAHVGMLRSRLSLNGGRDNIFRVSFRHNNPDVAYQVVRETVDLFMERGMGDSRLDLSASQDFIERQLENYERQLQEKEKEIEQFKRENARYLSGEGNFYSRLEGAREQLSQTRLQLREAQSRLQTLQRRARETAGPDAMARYENPELDRRIRELQNRLDEMRLRYTDEHPDVVAAKRILGDLEERREREAEAYAEDPASFADSGQSGRDPMQVAITEVQTEIASLRTRIREYAERVETLEQDVDRGLEVESELTSLTRNYDVLRDSYRQLLSRREQAIMSGEVETQTDAVDFRVLEPPRRPGSPSSPDRPMLATAVLILGLGAGTGFAWLLTQLRRTIGDTRQLAEVTGRPVLGAISRVRTPMHRRRRLSELVFFGLGVGSLLLVFAVVMALYMTGSDQILNDLIELVR